jgi:hypothetical protein
MIGIQRQQSFGHLDRMALGLQGGFDAIIRGRV